MMCRALEAFREQHNVCFEKVTQIPLEGEGTINKHVEKGLRLGSHRDNLIAFFLRFFFGRLYTNLLANREWMNDLHTADDIPVATHPQGSSQLTCSID